MPSEPTGVELLAFLEAVDQLLFVFDQQGNLLFTNQALTHRLGHSAEELLGQNVAKLFPPECREEAARIVAPIRNGTDDRYRLPLLAKDGRKIPAETRAVSGTWRGQAVTYGVAKELPIPGLSDAQAIARLQRWTADMQTKTLTLSPGVDGIGGWPAETNDLDTLMALVHPDDHDAVRSAWTQIAPDRPLDVEYRVLIDGEVKWLHTKAQLAFDEPSRPVGAFGVNQEITERKQTEELVYAQRDLARVVATVTSAEAAWPSCLAIALRASGMDSGGLYLFNAEQTALDLVHHHGLSPAFVQAVSHYGIDAPNVRMILTGQLLYFDAAELVRQGTTRHEEIRSLASIPITHHGRVLGCINVASHTLSHVPAYARHAIETLAAEIGNTVVYLNAETSLRNSEEKYRSLVDSQESAIATIDAGGVIHYMNRIGAAPLTESAEAIVGKKLSDFFPPEAAEWQLSHIREVLSTGKGTVAEYQNTIAGKQSWRRVSIQPIRNAAGQVTLAMVNSLDITVRKQVEEELQALNRTLEERVRERSAEVQDLYENAPVGYYSVDTYGNIAMINQTQLDWLGYAREEMLGHPLTDFISPATRAAFHTSFPLLKERGWIRDMEVEFVRRDGSTLPALVGATAIYDESDRYVTSRSTVFDNTERKAADDAQRHANQQLEGALRMKDEFLANMSHELRTPLNGILAFSEVLLEQVYGPINERQQRSLRNIEASGQHLLDLINDLLDLSKIEAGKLELNIETVSVDEICQASFAFVKEIANKKGLQISYSNDELRTQLQADPRRLKQMLVNLLSNAVKFTPEGGQIQLRVRTDPVQHVIRFAVQDSGPGIGAGDLPRLFQPFTQLDAALARQFEGTGLGLALVKRLAAQHGGTVEVTSDGIPGQGSCFTIMLPYTAARRDTTARDVSSPNAHRIAPLAPGTHGLRILLAEDNEVAIEALGGYLEFLGYQLITARTGTEALSLALAEQPPDLILMDIQLPLMDGLEVTRRLRQDARLAATPIIALTALAMAEDRTRCLQAGATEYMSKPFRPRELVALIGRLLNS